MITIVRTRDLAELRQRGTRADREAVADLVLRARKLALEAGSFLSYALKDTDEVVRKTRPVAEWITSGYPYARDLEACMLAATALLADLALDRPIPGISASPIDIKARPSGIAQGYMTVNLGR